MRTWRLQGSLDSCYSAAHTHCTSDKHTGLFWDSHSQQIKGIYSLYAAQESLRLEYCVQCRALHSKGTWGNWSKEIVRGLGHMIYKENGRELSWVRLGKRELGTA